jgi:hypothetical protein
MLRYAGLGLPLLIVSLIISCASTATAAALQVSDKERQAQQDNLFKDVAGVLVEKTVRRMQHGTSPHRPASS